MWFTCPAITGTMEAMLADESSEGEQRGKRVELRSKPLPDVFSTMTSRKPEDVNRAQDRNAGTNQNLASTVAQERNRAKWSQNGVEVAVPLLS